MKISNSNAVLFFLLAAAFDEKSQRASAFAPLAIRNSEVRVSSQSTMIFKDPMNKLKPSVFKRPLHSSALKMASEDFDQSKYTEAAWSTIASLTQAADYYQSQSIEAPLLLDLMLNPSKHNAGEDAESAKRVVQKILTKAGVNVNQLRSELEANLSKQPRITGANGQKTLGRSLQPVLDAAKMAKTVLGDSFVATEALLLALVKEDSLFTRDALRKQEVAYNDVLAIIKEMRAKNGPVISRSAENMYDALMKYGIDFTEQARLGKLDPVIGRDDEIRRAIQILSRRTKNNPVLIGDPGVGKTAV
jgi:ATP-dependent Clp protease ATP-binding subunit ClpB